MDIKGEYTIAASREKVWAALNDPLVLKACIPGCESLEMTSDTDVVAKIASKIGPVKARFDTSITLSELNPPVSYIISGEGKGGAAGFGRGSARVELADQGASTLLRYNADLKVGGKLAQVGSRLVVGVTRKIADDFFVTFAAEVAPESAAAIAAQQAPARKRAIPLWLIGAAIAAAAVVWLLLR